MSKRKAREKQAKRIEKHDPKRKAFNAAREKNVPSRPESDALDHRLPGSYGSKQ